MEEHDGIYREIDEMFDRIKTLHRFFCLLERDKDSMRRELDDIADALRAAGIKYPLVDRAEAVEEGREAAGAAL